MAPLQDSRLENPMDGGAWWAAVHGVAKSRTRLSDFMFTFTFMHWRRKWQPTPVFLPGESQGQRGLVGCRLWGHTESSMTEATQQQQQQQRVDGTMQYIVFRVWLLLLCIMFARFIHVSVLNSFVFLFRKLCYFASRELKLH